MFPPTILLWNNFLYEYFRRRRRRSICFSESELAIWLHTMFANSPGLQVVGWMDVCETLFYVQRMNSLHHHSEMNGCLLTVNGRNVHSIMC